MRKWTTGYMDRALFDLPTVLAEIEHVLSAPDVPAFDTLVGTGFSGGVIIPALAMRMGKQFALIRKESDDTHHSGDIMGALGGPWIFVDDFVSSGATRRRVVTKVREFAHPDYGVVEPSPYLGDLLYAAERGSTVKFLPPVEGSEEWGRAPAASVGWRIPGCQCPLCGSPVSGDDDH